MACAIKIRTLARYAVLAASLAVTGVLATPHASASGLYIYDSSHYRPMKGRERSTFRNPVGKLGPGVTRRLPRLTVSPAEFDFGGAGPIKSIRQPTLPPKRDAQTHRPRSRRSRRSHLH